MDGVQVECGVVRLLDLLRALLVEDLAEGASVPVISSDLKYRSGQSDIKADLKNKYAQWYQSC